MKKKPIDLSDSQINRWKVLKRINSSFHLCKCECGIEKNVRTDNLKNGTSFGCAGCHNKDKALSVKERFFSKVKVTATCWYWIAYKTKHGYGMMSSKNGYPLKAHRVSWEIFNGPIPANKVICHSCDNPSCVNPTHLFIGSQLDNINDMLSKNRGIQGEKVGTSKLTENDVRFIKKAIKNNVRQHVLAWYFGVNQSSISSIKNGKTWNCQNGESL